MRGLVYGVWLRVGFVIYGAKRPRTERQGQVYEADFKLNEFALPEIRTWVDCERVNCMCVWVCVVGVKCSWGQVQVRDTRKNKS